MKTICSSMARRLTSSWECYVNVLVCCRQYHSDVAALTPTSELVLYPFRACFTILMSSVSERNKFLWTLWKWKVSVCSHCLGLVT